MVSKLTSPSATAMPTATASAHTAIRPTSVSKWIARYRLPDLVRSAAPTSFQPAVLRSRTMALAASISSPSELERGSDFMPLV